jgi:myo-inositol catabolism protein IolS
MPERRDTAPVKIADKLHSPMGFGSWVYGAHQWSGVQDDDLLRAMESALAFGLTHFDTATGYGNGKSESLVGRFLSAEPGRREPIFLASKYEANEISFDDMLNAVDASLSRLQTEMIDLYYIHWPRTGKDLRPWMEALETARQKGKIRAIGVSNFSIEDMEQVAQVGKIDAHQFAYNLLWRFPERDLIPYCVKHDIAVVTYGSLAHGVLTGTYPLDLQFPVGDQRRNVVLLKPPVWPLVYQGIETLKAIAVRAGRPLAHLAIRWLLHQSGVTSVLVGARNAQQSAANAQAMDGDIPDEVFDEMTVISDELMRQIPDTGNPYAHHP